MKKKPELSLRTRALQYLARREYSRAELRGKLLAHVQKQSLPPDDGGFEQMASSDPGSRYARGSRYALPHPTALPAGEGTNESLREIGFNELDDLLTDLTERGYLSDERAAAQLLHARRGRFGTQRITHEMRQKGIPNELIEPALPGLQASELQAARDVWQRKFGALPQDAKGKARQMRFLQSRGFSFDVILKVLRSEPDIE